MSRRLRGIVGVAAASAFVGCGLTGCGEPAGPEPPAPGPTTLTFTVTGTGVDSAEVRHFTARTSGSRSDVPLPWSKTIFDPASSVVRLNASAAVAPGGAASVRCSITVSGEVVAETTSTDDPGDIVRCSVGLSGAQVP